MINNDTNRYKIEHLNLLLARYHARGHLLQMTITNEFNMNEGDRDVEKTYADLEEYLMICIKFTGACEDILKWHPEQKQDYIAKIKQDMQDMERDIGVIHKTLRKVALIVEMEYLIADRDEKGL